MLGLIRKSLFTPLSRAGGQRNGGGFVFLEGSGIKLSDAESFRTM